MWHPGRSDWIYESPDYRCLRICREHPGRLVVGGRAGNDYGMDNFIRPGSEENRRRLLKLGVTLFHGDIRCASDFEALPQVDWVIDAAANPSVLAGIDGQTSSRQLIEHNLLGTINILEYCKRLQSGFILISTSRVYSIASLAEVEVETHGRAFRFKMGQELPPGLSAAGVAESFSTAPPVSLYGSSKLASEFLALEYGETFGFPVWINRCGVLAGAGQFGRPDQGIFAYWINAWLRRSPLTYLGFGGNGYQVRDCLHPKDLISILRKQMSASTGPRRVMNFGGGVKNAMSLAQLSDWCRDRYGDHEVSGKSDMRRFDIPWMVMDSRLAGDACGWTPQTSLEKSLLEIADHARAASGMARSVGGVMTTHDTNKTSLEILSIVIPALDEEGCICSTVEHLHLELRLNNIPHEIVVVDDGGGSGTGALLRDCDSVPELKAVKEYRTTRVWQSRHHCADSGGNICGDAVVIMMADESDDCRDVVRYWQILNQGYDCVFGSRFIKGGGL